MSENKNSLIECVIKEYKRYDSVCSSRLCMKCVLGRADGLQNEEDQAAPRGQKEERSAAGPIA